VLESRGARPPSPLVRMEPKARQRLRGAQLRLLRRPSIALARLSSSLDPCNRRCRHASSARVTRTCAKLARGRPSGAETSRSLATDSRSSMTAETMSSSTQGESALSTFRRRASAARRCRWRWTLSSNAERRSSRNSGGRRAPLSWRLCVRRSATESRQSVFEGAGGGGSPQPLLESPPWPRRSWRSRSAEAGRRSPSRTRSCESIYLAAGPPKELQSERDRPP
jgi:hypothetical protein